MQEDKRNDLSRMRFAALTAGKNEISIQIQEVQDMDMQMEQTNTRYLSSEVRFYTPQDIMKMTGWGERVVNNLFKDPQFPSSDFGKCKVVEAHALIEYFAVRRSKKGDTHWTRGELSNELKKRVG